MTEAQHRAIFRQYYKLVYTIVQGRLRAVARHEDIEECVSDVFAEVFRKLETNAPEGELKHTIRMIAVRRAIDAFRSLAPRESRRLLLEETDELPDETSTAGTAEQRETNRILLQAVQALGEPDTTIILQKYWFGANATQIAKGLGITPSAVRKRAGKALARLKAALQAQGIEEGNL